MKSRLDHFDMKIFIFTGLFNKEFFVRDSIAQDKTLYIGTNEADVNIGLDEVKNLIDVLSDFLKNNGKFSV